MKCAPPVVHCQHCHIQITQSGRVLSKEEFLFGLCTACRQSVKNNITSSTQLPAEVYFSLIKKVKQNWV